MSYNPYNFTKDTKKQLQIAANYSRKAGKGILETLHFKNLPGMHASGPLYKICAFGACYISPLKFKPASDLPFGIVTLRGIPKTWHP